MATTNNSLDIPQNNGQLLIGSNGVAPMAANLTAGTNISIVDGAGTITINSTSASSLNPVYITSSPPGPGNQLVMAANTSYVVGNSTSSFPVQFVLPEFPTIGDQYQICTGGPNGPVTVLLRLLTPYSYITVYRTGSPTLGSVPLNQTGFIWLRYIGVTVGGPTYQIIIQDNITLT